MFPNIRDFAPRFKRRACLVGTTRCFVTCGLETCLSIFGFKMRIKASQRAPDVCSPTSKLYRFATTRHTGISIHDRGSTT